MALYQKTKRAELSKCREEDESTKPPASGRTVCLEED